MIVKNLSDRDKEARSYLQESRDFASWAAEVRPTTSYYCISLVYARTLC
jgi:hypothetical protein